MNESTRQAQDKPRYRWLDGRWLPANTHAHHRGTMTMSICRKKAVIHTRTATGYKTAAARVAEALGGRWSLRTGGYVMSSEARARAAMRLHAAGWDGEIMARELVPPRHCHWSPRDIPRGAKISPRHKDPTCQ